MTAPACVGPIVDAASARAAVQALQQRATEVGIPLRAPPPEPTTCCGRGCNGCVWEGFVQASQAWHEDAIALLG